LGAIDAAKARNNAYIIGVDSDQDGLAPGKILTSMVKHVDVAVYDIAQNIKSGKQEGGKHLTLGLADQAISLTDFQYTKDIVGPDIQNKVNALQQMIINHRIVVPATREALASFKPVKV
jgi:basic membrane protein A